MHLFLLIFLSLNCLRFHVYGAAVPEVVGSVDTSCLRHRLSKTSSFIPGASVSVECGGDGILSRVKTDGSGRFRARSPFLSRKIKIQILSSDADRTSTEPTHRKKLLEYSKTSFSSPASDRKGTTGKFPDAFFPPLPFQPPPFFPPVPGLTPPPLIPLPPVPGFTPPPPLIPLPPIPGFTPPSPPPFFPLPPIPFPGLAPPPPPPLFPLPPIPGFTPPSPPPSPFNPIPLPPIPFPGFTPPPPPPPPPPAFPVPLPPFPPLPFPPLPPFPGGPPASPPPPLDKAKTSP